MHVNEPTDLTSYDGTPETSSNRISDFTQTLALNLENVDKEGFDVEDFIERTKLMISVNSEYIIYLASLKK